MFGDFFGDIVSDVKSLKSWIKSFPSSVMETQKPILPDGILGFIVSIFDSENSQIHGGFYEEPNIDELDDTPDYPRNFGRKTSWFAVKTNDLQAVIRNLRLGDVSSANWETGFYFGRNSEQKNWVFLGPPIKGWVIIHVHLNFLEDEDLVIKTLISMSEEFGECQYFASYRVTGHASWWIALNGELVRGFTSRCDYKTNIGKTSVAELEIGLPNISGYSVEDLNLLLEDVEVVDWDEGVEPPLEHLYYQHGHYLKRLIEDEEDVFRIAEKWSLNPETISKVIGLEAATGYVGRIMA